METFSLESSVLSVLEKSLFIIPNSENASFHLKWNCAKQLSSKGSVWVFARFVTSYCSPTEMWALTRVSGNISTYIFISIVHYVFLANDIFFPYCLTLSVALSCNFSLMGKLDRILLQTLQPVDCGHQEWEFCDNFNKRVPHTRQSLNDSLSMSTVTGALQVLLFEILSPCT